MSTNPFGVVCRYHDYNFACMYTCILFWIFFNMFICGSRGCLFRTKFFRLGVYMRFWRGDFWQKHIGRPPPLSWRTLDPPLLLVWISYSGSDIWRENNWQRFLACPHRIPICRSSGTARTVQHNPPPRTKIPLMWFWKNYRVGIDLTLPYQ